MSKTKRVDFWKNEGETPYTKQTFHKNPGPGAYDIEKKKDDIKNKIIQEEAMHAAFNSSDVRPVNKKIKNANPGPGTYIDINNPMHCSIKSAQTSQINNDRSQQEEQGIKLGPFGSNNNRFYASWLNPKQGPDPGHYQKQMVKVNKATKGKYDLAIEGKSQASTRAFTAAEKERSKTNSIFMSTTDRFNSLEKSHPNVRILNPEKQKKGMDDSQLQNSLMRGVNQILKVGDKVQYDYKDNRTEWGVKGRAFDYEVFSGKNIGFDQTSPRFNYNQVFYGQSLKFDVPGPGQYPVGNRSDISYTSQPKNRARL